MRKRKLKRIDQNLFRDTETNIYYADFVVKGRRRRRSLRTAVLKKARVLLTQVKDEETIAAHFGHEQHSFLETAIKWAREYLPASVKAGTAKRYEVSVKQMKPYFKDKLIHDIGKPDIGNYVSARSAAGATNATIRRDLSALGSVLDFADGLGWRDGNPARDWSVRRIKEKPYIVTIPDRASVDRLIARCSPMFGACVRLLAETGMRQNEAVTLEWPQVDLQRREITLLKTKNSRPRVISIELSTALWLGRLPRHSVSQYVFWHGAGFLYANFSSRFAALVQSLKNTQAFTCHSLRHAYAVRQLKEGRDIYDLSRHLGHSSVQVTERYTRYVGQQEERREVEWHKAREESA